MEQDLYLSKYERDFVEEYDKRLKEYKNNKSEDYIVTPYITLGYALENNLYILNLLFHPYNLYTCKVGSRKSDKDKDFKSKIKQIIEYELESDRCYLNSEELDNTIAYYNKI